MSRLVLPLPRHLRRCWKQSLYPDGLSVSLRIPLFFLTIYRIYDPLNHCLPILIPE